MRLPVFFLLLLTLSSCHVTSHGAKILVYSVFTTNSHHMVIHPLVSKLADNGHDLTFLSSMKIKKEHPSITYFYPTKVVQFWKDILAETVQQQDRKVGEENAYTVAPPLASELCRRLIFDQEVQEWMEKATFDLVIINGCFNECGYGLAHKFRAPHVLIQTSSLPQWQADLYGIHVDSSVIPDVRLNYTQDMSFFRRVYNTLHSIDMYAVNFGYYYLPTIEGYLREALGDAGMPGIEQLARDVRLILINSYFPAEYALTLPPNVVSVGGLHCSDSSEKLPQNIEEFIQKFPEEGFVFISFGSMSKASEEFESLLIKVLGSKFPHVGFIMKWTGETIEDLPKNILPVSWAPQQVILGHPKIRAFMSHCGMLSVQEAAFYGVPVIATPCRADQNYNAACLVRLGVGVRLELIGLTIKSLEDSIGTILNDKRYKERMQTLSKVYRDRPLAPLDTAIWWLEFVLRHDGTELSNFKPLGIYQTWWQRRLIDVWAFLFTVLGIFLFIFVKILILLTRFFVKASSSKKEKKH